MAMNHGVRGSNPSSPTIDPKEKDLSFTFGGRKIMIWIADAKLWNWGVGLLLKWPKSNERKSLAQSERMWIVDSYRATYIN